MTARTKFAAVLLSLALASPAAAQGVTIGVVGPLSGPFALLGRQIVDGARAALPATGNIVIVTADDKCEADGGAEAARQLVAQKVGIVVGFLCTEALEAALPVLQAQGLAVITPGVRAPSLAEQRAPKRPPVFRLQPKPGMEAAAAANALSHIWRDALFAVIDDGTIYGRDLAETVRLDLDQKGLKSVFNDTYRPGLDNQVALITRLKRAGATDVFVGGQRDDIAVIGRDAAKLGYPLVLAGGEALRAAPGVTDLQPGTLMIAPVPPETLASASKADQAITAAGGTPLGYTVPAYAAVEIATDALVNAGNGGKTVPQALAAMSFSTAMGPVRFGADGSRETNPYRLYRYDGSHFIEVRQQ